MNYQKELEKLISNLDHKPTLLLHSCCAPCSSYVLEYLEPYFKITVLYYNPNIEPYEEYLKRKNEQINFIKNVHPNIDIMDVSYDNDCYLSLIKGLESDKEGGSRCYKCYTLRMEKTALLASLKYEYFGTTLSVSPHKNANYINEIGKMLENKYNVKFLVADFKKNEGYKRSISLSREYNLYRQDYCGCKFSKRD